MRPHSADPRPIGRPLQAVPRTVEPLLRNSAGISGLPVETPIEIEINGVPVATLICSPESLDELVAGWCFAQGYIDGLDDISRLTVRGGRAVVLLKRSLPGGHDWREQLTSGFDASRIRYPGATRTTPPPRDDFVLDARSVLALSAELFERFDDASGNRHGAHAGATNGATIITTAHDLSRHNSFDKLIGWSILSRHDLGSFIVAMRGRVCASTIFRAVRAGIRILVSDEIPTVQAVKLAQGGGMTVIGDVESARRTIYSHPWRIDRGAM